MNSRELHSEITKSLVESGYDQKEAGSISLLILEHFYNLSNIEILTNKRVENPDRHKEAMSLVTEGKPIQYVLGTAHFYGLDFHVNPSVLIPRPETEELVDLIIRENSKSKPAIIDIGTGSGCIAIALAKNIPNSSVIGIDKSIGALKVAAENAQLNQVQVEFQNLDILLPGIQLDEVDIIVSNPPYVRLSEKEVMEDRVIKHEPGLALFVSDKDPLIYYRHIARLAKKSLAKNGSLYFEINEAFSREVSRCLSAENFRDIEVLCDLSNKPRIVKGVLV
jgi:release factor glutamine methyltransferase